MKKIKTDKKTQSIALETGPTSTRTRKGIKIDKDTQSILGNLMRSLNETQERINLLCQIYLNAKRAKGEYALSSDMKNFNPREKKD